ncbi:prefoldin subunit beta [Methanobrevibacter filiformis]|uniref:Prefoldin subunit beta n=1 Tax=Methanobrevibacter filiformis TaxID=55758 RepID=A0A162FGF3_9EURY|nr:prefoldin subunit beta [Methanobrevibacter filiformis]KZX12675.1 prefoldin subunit beta [Methanobrevibacter filiformis]
MDVPQNIQHQINQFQQLQQQAQAVTVQKQNVDIQIKETEVAIEELKKTESGAEVFKTAGNILIKVDRDEINDELTEKLETLQLREKTMARQEERVLKKLQEMQTSIQDAMKLSPQ